MEKIRPQILTAIGCATLFAVTALLVGLIMGAVEIVTGIVGAFLGFVSGVSFKVLESSE